MKRSTKIGLGLGAVLVGAAIFSSCTRTYAPLDTVGSVDLKKYQGRWYEIARLPQRFEKDCYAVFADYTIHPDGYVEVHNSCRKGSLTGEVKDANGKAFPVEGSNNSKLRVQFFWPFRGDYWVLKLDPENKHVLVGSPDRESMWILARTPQLDASIYKELVDYARDKGFPVDELEHTVQPCS
jgi:apolipoprotein D and lipocalin family protein